jgi:hypothetical protein
MKMMKFTTGNKNSEEDKKTNNKDAFSNKTKGETKNPAHQAIKTTIHGIRFSPNKNLHKNPSLKSNQ